MRIGSLFSGIGGLELGLEWAGFGPVLWQVERAPFARSVLAEHWPTVQRYDDVCTVGAHNLEKIDLLCGGFPCQNISCLGNGKGLDGAKSGLWREFLRIIGELQPRYIIVENVSMLRAQGLESVLRGLAACGYDAWWDCLRASDFGAPHQRERIFIIAMAHADCHRQNHRQALGVDQAQSKQSIRNQSRQANLSTIQHLHTDLAQSTAAHRRRQHKHALAQSGLGGAAHGLSAWLDRGWPAGPQQKTRLWEAPRTILRSQADPRRAARIQALGNAVMPQMSYIIGGILRQFIQLQEGIDAR